MRRAVAACLLDAEQVVQAARELGCSPLAVVTHILRLWGQLCAEEGQALCCAVTHNHALR